MGYPLQPEVYRDRVESAMQKALSRCGGPPRLLESMGYSLLGGGKRLRPVLLLVTRDIFPEGGPDPMPAACALEFIHTYSLIHDDLPAMDDDDLRRNRPSCHKQFDEATAILAGDALLTQAFWLLADACESGYAREWIRVVAEIAKAAGSEGMVGGQVLDTMGTGCGLTKEQLERVHRMKTGALIRAAVRCGAILGGAGDPDLVVLTRCAENMGLAFQVVDDVLDVIGQQEELGKTIGKDESQGKTTYVTQMGVDGSREYARSLALEVRADLGRFGDSARALVQLSDLIVNRVF